jgi:hypothetical protein
VWPVDARKLMRSGPLELSFVCNLGSESYAVKIRSLFSESNTFIS